MNTILITCIAGIIPGACTSNERPDVKEEWWDTREWRTYVLHRNSPYTYGYYTIFKRL
jgi:hypothetical protein